MTVQHKIVPKQIFELSLKYEHHHRVYVLRV